MTAPAPTTCPRCDGETFVELLRPGRTPGVDRVVEAPCPDCCCPCGAVTGGRICDDCLDEITDDARHRRLADV